MLSDVLYKRRKELGLTLADIAKRMGVSEATVQRWESGNIKTLRHGRLGQLAEILNVSPIVLLDVDEKLPSPHVTTDVVSFPVIGSIAAGYEHIADENWSGDTVDIPLSYLKGRSKEDYFVLSVDGDSMYPLYQNGDKVLILKQSTLNRSGDIGAILYDDEKATLKKVEYVPGENWLKLLPVNPTYQPQTIVGEALEHCRIIGIPKLLIREIE